jgi:hypothetical protein
MQQARHQPLVHDGALESTLVAVVASWSGLVSASTLLLHQLGEDGKAERGVPATARAAELASQVQQEQSEPAELDCPPIG